MCKRALIYARVSYDDRGNEARNLQGQIEDGREYCADRGYQVVAALAEDDKGASGASWNLPKLNQALDMARAGEFDVFVTRELDRFARNLAKQLVIEGEFERYGVEVEYILAEYDDSPEGRLNKHIRAVIAEFEREKINQRMTRGRRLAVKKGRVMVHGNKPPYGYRLKDEVLVIYEPEARIVRLVFTWYVYGDETGKKLGTRAIARKLTGMRVPTWADTHSQGFPKKKGRGEWGRSTVQNILANETYAGTWYYGRRPNNVELNPRESWIPVEVPAIVSRELWERAQERREYNKRMARPNVKYEYLVGGHVTCGHCRTKMGGKSTLSPKGRRYLYYHCPAVQGRVVGCECDNQHFRADQVDAAVWFWVKEFLLNPEALRESLKEQQAEQEEANRPLHDRLSVVDDLLADNQKQLEKLLDLYLSGDFDKAMLTERKARLEATIAALEKERANLLTSLEAQALTDDQIASIEEFAKEVVGGLSIADMDFEARRCIIEMLDTQVTLTIEGGQKVAHVRCLVGEEEVLSLEATSSTILGNTMATSSCMTTSAEGSKEVG